MPRLLRTLLVMAFCGPLLAAADRCAAQDITTGLIGHWKLTETSGSTAVDSSPSGRNGTYTNGPSLATSTPAPFTSAVSAKFDGNNDYVAISGESTYDLTGAMTVAAWIKVDVFDVDHQAFVAKGDTAWRLHRKQGTNLVEFSITTPAFYEVASTSSVNDGEWHHLVGVYTGNQLRIYVDGVLENSSAIISASISTNNYAVNIGRNEEMPGREFDGAIYDVRVYNRALSQTDVTLLYSQGKPVLHWKLNEASGSTADDSSGANDGTVVGTATWIAGRRHNGFDFNGSTKIEATTLNGSPTNFTLACWARIDGTDTNGAEGVSVGDYFSLRMHDVSTGGPRGQFFIGSGNYRTVAISTSYIGQGWHHFAVTFDDSANSLKLYIDGVNVATTSTTSSITWGGLGTKTRAGSAGNVSTNYDLDGALDDVRVYTRALSQSEIADVYGLIGHWKLNQTSGTTATDSSGKALNGTYTNSPSLAQAGPYPGAGANAPSFDGTNDYVNGASATNYDEFEDGFSIAGWVYINSYVDSGAMLEVGSTTDSCSLAFSATGQVKAIARSSGGQQFLNSVTALPLRKWRHVVVTYDGSNYKIYIDGKLDTTQSNAFTLSTAAGNLTLGVSLFGADDYFNGRLQDVRLYNRALVAEEAAELYGLIGHWKLDETSGTLANDSSLMNNDGTCTNGPTRGQTGPYPTAGQYATQFDGTNDYVDLGDVATDLSQGFAFAVWARPTNTGSWQRFIEVSDGEDDENILFGRNASTTNLSLRIYDGSAGVGTLTATGAIENNAWHHYVGSCDNAGNAVIYRDGQQVASGNIGTATDVVRATNYIARSAFAADAYYQGMLQDARLFSRPLSTSEVAEIYGLVGHWKLNEGSGSTIADSSGTGANGAFNTGTPAWLDAIYGKGLNFSGSNDAITSAAFSPPALGTVAFWMRPTGVPGSAQRQLGESATWEVWQGTDGVVRFDMGCDGDAGGFETVSTPTLNGTWYHVVAMYNAVDNSYAIYLNGTLDKTGTSSSDLTEQTGAQLAFGTRTGSTNRFIGALDDIRIYNRKLSPWEVSQLYGLMAWYKLDETSGTVATDSTGRGQDGTYTGSPTLNVAANGAASQGTAAAFNGSNYVQASGLYDLSSSVSAGAWVRLDGADSQGAEAISLGDYFRLRLNSGTSGAVASYYNGSSWVSATASQIVLNTGWHHFAAVLDGGSTLKLYIDGAEAASTATSGAISYSGQGANTRIASHGNGATNVDLTGRVDDVRVFNRALKSGEVYQIYRGSRINGIKILQWVEAR